MNTHSPKAMILAAGLGTRLKPWTDHHPKALALVNGKSLLQRNVAYLQGFGINDIIVNVHHFAQQVKDAIYESKGWGSNISISDESDQVLETGGGLKKASWYFEKCDGPFVLMNADILTDLDINAMLQQHIKEKALATLAVTKRPTSRYLLFNEKKLLCGWMNEKTGETKGKPGTRKAFSGIHIIDPEIFSHITEEGKFSMIDLYLRLCNDYPVQEFDHTNGLLQDVGKPESIAEAEKKFR
ncbi:MAG: sugar phosphate nucleotidyltransferase [Ferruginibacter sp.]